MNIKEIKDTRRPEADTGKWKLALLIFLLSTGLLVRLSWMVTN